MPNKTAGISKTYAGRSFSIMLQSLLLGRELLWLSVLRVTLLWYLLISLLILGILLVTVWYGLITLHRHSVGLRRDGPESLTHGDLFCRMGEPVRYHEDPERTEQYDQEPDYR